MEEEHHSVDGSTVWCLNYNKKKVRTTNSLRGKQW